MQMRYINKGILFIARVLSFLQGTKLYAQQTLIDVSIDSAATLIGEQTVLHLTVTTDNGKNVIVPIPNDTLMTGVEVLNIAKADTTVIDNNRLLIKQIGRASCRERV